MASNAIETQKQENGSMYVFESVVERNKFPTKKDIEKNVYPKMPDKWLGVYQAQSIAIKKYLKGQKQYLYSRDKGIMPFIEKLASSKMGASVKDRWNPMDIIMVKRQGENKIKKEIEKIANITGMIPKDKLIKLNLYMKELLKDKILIPISLKEVKVGIKEAKVEEANLKKKSKGVKFKLKPNSLKCDLDMVKPPLFDTGELAFDMFADDEEIHVQARSFRYSIPSTVIQTDLTPKGRQSGAKLGKASTEAIDKFLKSNGLERPKSPTNDTMIEVDGKFTKAQLDFWSKFYDRIKKYKIQGQQINYDAPLELGKKISNLKDIIKYGLKHQKKDRNTLGRLCSKLVGMRWIEIYYKIDQKKKFEEWLSVLYYGAKKEFSDTNGPFIKIY
jgi:hypothetical protein|tara:strand:- start:45 stop:1208 length:1164 start_codon:yes stop_codon:yes gene_type:complete